MTRHLVYRALFLMVGLAAATAGASCGESASGTGDGAAAVDRLEQTAIDRGRHLVTVGGCHDCHTPKRLGPGGPEPDMERMLSGHPETLAAATAYTPAPGSPWTVATNDHLTAWSGPWGVSFAANLTPDPNTGLRSGVWTKELFIAAMRTGKHMGTSREILPPMPWQNFAQLDDDDLGALWAYLGTIPAINNHVPEPIEPTPPRTDTE